MKRICALTSVILLILGLTTFSTVRADVSADTSRLMNDAPQEFNAYGFQYEVTAEEIPPFHYLQSQLAIEFNSGQEVHTQSLVSYNRLSIYGQAEHILDLYLNYDRDSLAEGQPFISGTFVYHWDRNGETSEYTGTITGSLVEISTDVMGFVSDYEYTNAIALDLDVEGDAWDWTIYLEVLGEEQYYLGHMIVGYNSEETPHVPSPDVQADVAAGVGVSTVGIAVANALTKTTVMGGVSISPPLDIQPASINTDISQPVREAGSGFFSHLLRFFKNLFENLRDMLTDEGRSFASGRLSENLGDIGADDISGSDTE